MTAEIAQIWRYPIKGVGAEALAAVAVQPGLPLPRDRAWAILQDGGDDRPGWRSCRNFLRAAKGPGLMAVQMRAEGDGYHLSHPDLETALTIDPRRDAAGPALINWLRPIYPADRPAPVKLVSSPPEGMSDAPFASVSIMNLSSLRALGQKLGRPLDPRRFRGNLWVDGWAPWEEFDMVGQRLRIGDAEFEGVEPITRCRATEANPETGKRDADTLGALKDGWGHQEFGVNLRVGGGGRLRLGDTVSVA